MKQKVRSLGGDAAGARKRRGAGVRKSEDCMNVKAVCSWALVLTAVGVSAARAQEVSPPSYGSVPPPPANGAPDKLPPVHGLSDWITYTCPDCCGPVGGHGPIGSEIYLRSGWSIPEGGKIFHSVLETGWMIEGGARLLLFNPPMDAAWTFGVGLISTYNHGQRDDIPIKLFLRDNTTNPMTGALANPGTFIERDVTVRNLHRTYVAMELGREWFLNSSANDCNWKWRAGFDIGGRYGTMRVDLDQFQTRSFFRRNDVIGELTFALHTDVEIPCGCCTFLGGVRAEYGYNWSDIFQAGNHSDLQELNLLFNLGVRF
jgi:hypothetical protein